MEEPGKDNIENEGPAVQNNVNFSTEELSIDDYDDYYPSYYEYDPPSTFDEDYMYQQIIIDDCNKNKDQLDDGDDNNKDQQPIIDNDDKNKGQIDDGVNNKDQQPTPNDGDDNNNKGQQSTLDDCDYNNKESEQFKNVATSKNKGLSLLFEKIEEKPDLSSGPLHMEGSTIASPGATIQKCDNLKAFLEDVKKYPFLYNKEDTKFKDKELKKITWSNIGDLWKIDGSTVKMMWRGLRIRYLKERYRVISSEMGGTGNTYKSTWELYSTVDEILQPCLEKLPPVTKSKDTNTDNYLSKKIKKEKDDTFSSPPDSGKSSMVSSPANERSNSKTSLLSSDTLDSGIPAKRRRESELCDVLNAMGGLVQSATSFFERSSREGDVVKKYCEYLEARLRNLEPVDRRSVMRKIELLMLEKEKC